MLLLKQPRNPRTGWPARSPPCRGSFPTALLPLRPVLVNPAVWKFHSAQRPSDVSEEKAETRLQTRSIPT